MKWAQYRNDHGSLDVATRLDYLFAHAIAHSKGGKVSDFLFFEREKKSKLNSKQNNKVVEARLLQFLGVSRKGV